MQYYLVVILPQGWGAGVGALDVGGGALDGRGGGGRGGGPDGGLGEPEGLVVVGMVVVVGPAAGVRPLTVV